MSGAHGRAFAGVAAAVVMLVAGCERGPGEVTRVVFVTLDTTRADRIGCYGYAPAETPALDGLAAEGVVFEQAVAPAPTTMPSHASMFTGLYPHDHGVRYNIFYRLADSAFTLAEALEQAGFTTAAFPATQVVAARFGLDQGFAEWHDPPRGDPAAHQGGHPIAPLRSAGAGVDLALDFFRRTGSTPSFAWLHFYDAHWPYAPPFPFSSSHRDRPYDGEIAYMDRELGRLLDALRSSPGWDTTLVVVAGDHGEGLYDHDERYHSTLLYETTQRVPLIVRAPGVRPRRVAEPVSLVDLMPTVLDLAGVPGVTTRGTSLRPALTGGELPRRDIYAETLAGAINFGWSELYSLRFGSWKLIESSEPELFDLDVDPAERTNLAPFEPARVAELRAALGTIAAPLEGNDPGEEARIRLDAETEHLLQSLGYVAGGVGAAREGNAIHPRRMIHLEPELLEAQGSLARRDFARVEDVCRYVLSQDPTNRWAMASLVTALLGESRPGEALEVAKGLTELNPTSEQSWVLLALAHRDSGHVGETRAALAAGLERSPDSEQLRYLNLVAAFELGGPDPCPEAVPGAVATHAESARMRILEARCRARAGDTVAALAALEAAADLGFRGFGGIAAVPEFEATVAAPGFAELRARVESGAAPGESK